MNKKLLMVVLVLVFLLGYNLPPAGADEGHGRPMHEMCGTHGGGGHEMGGHPESTGHYLRHLLRHSKEIGLSADQMARLKTIQLDLSRTRIKTEAEIQVAELEVAALTEDEKADLSAIEAKVKQSEMLEAGLRMAAIKAQRDARALLTPEQREKEAAEHEKMMMQMGRGMMHGMPEGMMPGGMMGEGMMEGGHRGPPH